MRAPGVNIALTWLKQHNGTLTALAFTAVLTAYWLVWLPHPVVGLSLIGLEMGEWVKFLPQLQAGQVAADRHLFYLPPITLGLAMVLGTAGWPNRRWQSWAMRLLAVIVALLTFPSLDALRFEAADQWLYRLLLILLVALPALLSGWLGRLPPKLLGGLKLGVGLTGALLPTWAYFFYRPLIAAVLVAPIGIGPGVWLNFAGHTLLILLALTQLSSLNRNRN